MDINNNGTLIQAVTLVDQQGNAVSAGGGAPAWGTITGTLTDQTDLNTALAGKRAIITGTPNVVYATNNSNQQINLPYLPTGSANALIVRDSAGRAQVAAPSAANDIATKGYVDGALSPAQRTAINLLDPATSTLADVINALKHA